MGKKGKFGKNRKDKFYHLAKETGYRARSAFKLIQLNRKFGFLAKSRVLIDLCAAPGGWLQVAEKFMPVSSVIIGVDLVPIKRIKNCTTFVADITTDSCRQMIKKEIKTWKADCVLHDGAPNVGSAWVQDAFTQAQLTLSSLKLATEFLNKGGCFVTKIFRSKDYAALLTVFEKLFKSVQATKPQASRNESAEIFVVCRGYKAPSKLDQSLLDPKCVFKEPEEDLKIRMNILHPEKITRQRQGYPENNIGLFTATNISEFVETGNPVEILSTTNRLTFDVDKYKDHELTTEEIKICCDDIKVLGKRELRLLFNWRKKIRPEFGFGKKAKQEEEKDPNAESEDENSEEKIATMIEEAKNEENATAKRKRRKDQERKQKLNLKLRQDKVATEDAVENLESDLFRLNSIKSKSGLQKVDDGKMDEEEKEFYEDSDEEELEFESSGDESDASSNYDYHDDDEMYGAKNPKKRKHEDIEGIEAMKMKRKIEKAQPSDNPLLIDYEKKNKNEPTDSSHSWFNKDIFKDADDSDEDEDYDIEQMMKNARKEGVEIQADQKSKSQNGTDKTAVTEKDDNDSGDSEDEEDDQEVYDIDDRSVAQGKDKKPPMETKKSSTFEIAPQEPQMKYLSEEGLAIGTAMVTSKRRRRDIIDDSFNRYSLGSENVPNWFAEEEAQHRVRQLPVTKDEINAYKERMKEVNARPIKKVVEARCKKKYKLMKKLEKARKKAATISEEHDVSEKEKLDQIKGIYKRAGLLSKKKEEKTYVVAKKSLSAKRYTRPANVKGHYKVVDPRMKKETRANKRKEKAQKKKRR